LTVESARDGLLNEMGLGPVWRLRSGAARGAAPPEGDNSTAPGATQAATEGPGSGLPPGISITVAGNGPAEAGDEPALARPATGAVADASPAVTGGESRQATISALSWNELPASIAACTACGLCRTRKRTVPGVGVAGAEWMFVGEAPGADEDAQGEPFVGQAGRLLDNMLKAVDLSRTRNVYIANVLKCRPPNNRNPEPGEVTSCSPYLERQLELIRPRLIVALGRFAALTLLDTDATIASLRGRVHAYRGVPLIVTYHPAYLLRSLPEKAKAWEDLLFARRTFAGLQSGESPPPEAAAKSVT
jgi:uracil-DNA glycosylase